MKNVIPMKSPADWRSRQPAATSKSWTETLPSGIDQILALRCGPGIIVHPGATAIDDLLIRFSQALRARGFKTAGFVQRNHQADAGPGYGCAQHIELLDLDSQETFTLSRGAGLGCSAFRDIAAKRLTSFADADLLILSHFGTFGSDTGALKAVIDHRVAEGKPVLTSIAGRCVDKWQGQPGARRGVMVSPDMASLWQWWGPERIYQDLAQGVADVPVDRVVCGPRWIMVSGPAGAGVAFIPPTAKAPVARLPHYRRASLRQLAALVHSWDGLDMAVGIAAVNAHYNRLDLQGDPGNGVAHYRNAPGSIAAVGVFPGLKETLPTAMVIKHEPAGGEYPLEAMENLLPHCAAVVVTSSNIANRKLPRILRLADGADIALIGPSTPLSPRLFDYGLSAVGGLVINDAAGLAEAIRAGAPPREFEHFGRYLHLRRSDRDP